MAVEWKDIAVSSNVAAVGYDSDTEELYVRWSRGKNPVSIYSGVPPDVAEACANSWSVGSFLNSEIKGRFAHRYA